jgi:uncharacterized protein
MPRGIDSCERSDGGVVACASPGVTLRDMSAVPYIRECDGGVRVSVHVQPRARQTRIVGQHGDALKIQLASPPVDGKANAALRDFLAATLDLPRAQVSLVAGQRSRAKTLLATGIDLAGATDRLS